MLKDKEFLVKGSLVNGLGLTTRVISPFLMILLARVYSLKDFGLFVSVQAMALVLSRVAVLGLDKGLLWYVPKVLRENETGGQGLASSLRLSSGIFAVMAAFFLMAAYAGALERFDSLRDISMPFLLLMIGSVWPITAIHLFSSALEGLRLPHYRVFIALFLTTSAVPLIALLLRPALGDEISLGAGMFLGNMLGFLAFIPVVRRKFPGEAWLGSGLPPREMLRYSWPLAISELISNVWTRVDLWLILVLLGPEKAAIFAVMVTITNGLRTVRQTFDPLLIPIVSNMKAEDLATNLRPSFSYATNMVSTIQLFIACFILFFPGEILSLAGKDYAIEIFAFALLLMGNLVNGFLGLNGLVMLGMGKSRIVLGATVCVLILNLLLSWLLIPRLGITGAAISASLALLLLNLVFYFHIRFVEKLDLYERHLRINGILEILFLAVLLISHKSIATISLGGRAGLFGLVLLALAGVMYLKRGTYALK